MNKTLTHSMKSYITIFLVGILVGCICRLTDYCPADTLWSFSSIQTLLGFWIITNTIIVLASTSNICAGISSFLYVWNDIEFLWITSNIRNIHTFIFWWFSYFTIYDIYYLFNPLCNSSVYLILLE